MIVIDDRLGDENFSTLDLLKRCKISKLDPSHDRGDIEYIMNYCFKMPIVASKQLVNDIDYNASIKLHDGKDIYGLLLFTNNKIKDSIPGINHFNPLIANLFDGVKQKNGEAFILDKRLQGIGLDKLMLQYALELLKRDRPEIVWLGVNRELKSHNYWKRHGFTEFYSDMMVRFYFKFLE